MDIQSTPQKLVHEILTVVISKVLSGVYNSMHIRFHQVCDDVNIFETFGGGRLLHVYEPNNVLMIKELYMIASESKFDTYSTT